MKSRIHGVEDILLGFEPKDAGSIPAGSARFFFFSGEITCNILTLPGVLNFTEHEVRQENGEAYKTRNKKRLQIFEEPRVVWGLVAQEGYYFSRTFFLHFVQKRDCGICQYRQKRQEN